jgi:hypothetical protein
MQARFPDGTFSRIAAVLASGEDRTDFVRTAVENELDRREGPSVRRAATERDASASKRVRKRK